jgi:hypothetical protein
MTSRPEDSDAVETAGDAVAATGEVATADPSVETVELPEATDEVADAGDVELPDEVADAGDVADAVEPEVAVVPDERLLAAHDLALAALGEITPAPTVGDAAGYTLESDGVVSLRFETTLPGYPGWFWTVSLARVADADPTVLEVELLPGDGALLAPDWVPWAVRLADYQAQQAALAEAAALEGAEAEEELDELDDIDDLDAADYDEDGSPLLHAGDVDGVDIDVLDDSDEDDSDEDDSDEDDSDEDDSDDDAFDADELDDAEDSDDDAPSESADAERADAAEQSPA